MSNVNINDIRILKENKYTTVESVAFSGLIKLQQIRGISMGNQKKYLNLVCICTV